MNEYRARNHRSSVFGFSDVDNIVPKNNEISQKKGVFQMACHATTKKHKEYVPQLSLDGLLEEEEMLKNVDENKKEIEITHSNRPEKSSCQRTEHVPELNLELSQTQNELRDETSKMQQQKQFQRVGHHKKTDFIEKCMVENEVSTIADEKPTSPIPKFGFNDRFDSRAKRHEDIYKSRAVLKDTSLNDTSERFGFGARIITADDHDARREVKGFYFLADQTIVMYEFRQFGTRCNAMPFIKRAGYIHLSGERHGQLYSSDDIFVGNTLSFETSSLSNLPDSMKRKNIASFRITEIDSVKANTIEGFFHQKKCLEDEIQASVRKQLKTRGSKTLTNLHAYFGKSRLLGLEETKKVLSRFRIKVTDEEFARIWSNFDDNGIGIDFSDFLNGFVGQMNEVRKAWVHKAFSRVDPNRTGVGKLSDVRKFFNVAKQPTVQNGELTGDEFMDELIECLRASPASDVVFFTRFEAYYEGKSMALNENNDFIVLVRQCWTL